MFLKDEKYSHITEEERGTVKKTIVKAK